MSFERAITSRKEELVVLTNALKKAKKEKDTGHIDFLKERIEGLNKAIQNLEQRQRQYWQVQGVIDANR